MSSFSSQKPVADNQNRNVIIYLASGFWLLVSGCSFHTVYGDKSNGKSQALAGVRIDGLSRDPLQQQLQYALEDKLNPGGMVPLKPRYSLTANYSTSESAIGVGKDGTVSRYNVNINSGYVLYRTIDGAKVTSGSVHHVSSYNNVQGAYFSTFGSKEDALKRGISEIAEIYRQRLIPILIQEKPPALLQSFVN